MKTERTHTNENFDYPDGYFADFERRLNERIEKPARQAQSSLSAQKNLPLRKNLSIWWHVSAASLIAGLFAFALWPKSPGAEAPVTESEWLAWELSSMHEVEIIHALYEANESTDSLAHLAEYIEWDAWEWFLYENALTGETPTDQNQF